MAIYCLFKSTNQCQRLNITPDPRVPNCILIKFEREDHTLGNVLRQQLINDPRVIFVAYKIEHPLFANFVMRLQTEEGYKPRDALRNACSELINLLGELSKKFDQEWQIKALVENNADDDDDDDDDDEGGIFR